MKNSISISVKTIAFFFITTFILRCFSPTSQAKPAPDQQEIMIALLLDTSNSMDGLIEQAKSQLWTIVNELAAAKCGNGTRPEIKIALFEYGNDNLPQAEGYMRMVTDLTTDLDDISEKLFALSTNGGDEYCGYAIDKSIQKLNWSKAKTDLKMIFIAGNEPFTQGNVTYESACNLAKQQDIVVNTIYCGDYQEGVRSSWRHGATLTGGSYMSIQQNQKTVYVPTPYDDKIDRLNDEMNKTYIYYGAQGKSKKEKQIAQDANAESYSQSNKVSRAISKSSHAYKNSSWDLVDAYEDDAAILESVEEEYLPAPMQNMDTEEKKSYVKELTTKRAAIKKDIQTLSNQRKQYIAAHKPAEASENTLDHAMINSIKEVGKSKQLIFK
ncbi:VWA domain-containing protein [Reichenbachiella carrageenanivorans]|uniref:VWA domain-containing protein n=1 Tax=Reichenbachiella carrageenanivorans TaxID=2979869 RepID=A0ABY6CWW6_9BACT|nr:VWA domain-containing protein [Reichenbachiella carrageenanivorans]UXX78416.1 VWA domain-containing protein [Reichenbachiella carrageenanivorans]